MMSWGDDTIVARGAEAMLDIQFIRDHADQVRRAASQKRFEVDVDAILALDERRRALIHQSETMRSRRNEIAAAMKSASPEQRKPLIEEGRAIKASIAADEAELADVEARYFELMMMVPNVCLPEVPVGQSDDDNVEVRRHGEPRSFEFEPLDHEELGERLGILDKPRAIKVAGARSYALRGVGAMLEQAVLRLALDLLYERGFELITGPVMVLEEAMTNTGFFPYGRENSYELARDDRFLIGTSEVVLVSLSADEILERDQMPVRRAGLSPCFRREAGAAGRDTRGIYRVHQFTKVEQVVICEADPELSRSIHDELLSNSEELLRRLEIPYRVVLVCTGEIGLGQVLKHDIESWMPSRGSYGETHSCSSMYDYQARRSKIRYRDASGEMRYCYTLNNTMIASPRILIPILENYQNEDGSVTVPRALRPYLHGIEVVRPPET